MKYNESFARNIDAGVKKKNNRNLCVGRERENSWIDGE